jgi:hypothetical protein
LRKSPKPPEQAGVSGGPQVEADAQERPPDATEHGADRVDSLARRAYERFQTRGGEHGRDQEDWLEAERELNDNQDE